MYIGHYAKYPLILSDFHETPNFSTDFKKYSYIIFDENSPNGSRVDHADWQMDGSDEANSRFSQFCERI